MIRSRPLIFQEPNLAKTRRGVIGALGAAVLLAGCSTLGLETAPRIYDLRAPTSIDVGAARTSRQLLVADPASVRFYATDRIVVRDSAATLAYFPDALWSDALPDLLQARFAEALERTGRARAVGRPGQGLLINTRLVPEIRSFEMEIGEGSSAIAVVDISLKVMNDANGRILASSDFTARVPAASDGVDEGVEALNAALGAVLADMVRFVLNTV
ncbi:MAG: ABC-type transport auxiliary lipoprotein family protein [Devosiaceae bacterium]